MQIIHSAAAPITALLGLFVAAAPVIAHEGEHSLDRVAAFLATANLASAPEVVDCTLSAGTQSSCYKITVRPSPQSYTPGPWCPRTITDGPEAGGIWFLDGETVDVDGKFISSLAEIYGDANWQLYDPETGAVRFTGSLEACQAAARPDVDPAYQNYCVECLPEYLPDDATITYLIPVEPVMARRPTPIQMTGAGIAFNGVRLDGPAPVDAILAAYTIAPFDDCGGHVNPHVGYHYHAVTDCLTGAATTLEDAAPEAVAAHGGQIGLAMDGQAILAHLMADGTEPGGLDACFGHASDGLPYHYHAGASGSNQIIGCLSAEPGCIPAEGETACDARRPPRP